MKIEEVNPVNINKNSDAQLYELRLRFLQVWNKYYDNQITKNANTERSVILNNYQILKKEMEGRNLPCNVKDIDKVLFAKSMLKIDVPSLEEQVISEDFISLCGDYLKNPMAVENVDVLVKSSEHEDNDLIDYVTEIIKTNIGKTCTIHWNNEIDNFGVTVPLYDIVLKPKAVTKRVEVEKIETTDKYHRIPVNDCKITATIDISKEKGIKALYCGDDKKIATYLFDVNKFTLAKAKDWVKIHKSDSIEKVMEEEPTEPISKSIKIFKMDAPKQIVGGVIYAPDEVDTQGDKASAEEIEKAAHEFNLGRRVFKVMHDGKQVNVDLLETYLMPADVVIYGEKITKGSWFAVVRVNDKKVWKKIESGELTGFSMGGQADRIFSIN